MPPNRLPEFHEKIATLPIGLITWCSGRLSNAAIAAGLRSVRLTGLVQEGTSLRALVDDGLTNSSLGVGDPFDFGSLHGLGFRLTSISFDQGAISISNGRVEHQIFAPQ